MKDFILELYSEEIPARMQKNAESGFYEIFKSFFVKNNINYNNLEVNISPCRISISSKITEIIKGSDKEVKGPKIDANEFAIQGFCKKHKTSTDKLEIRDIVGVKFYFHNEKKIDLDVKNILKNNLESLIKSYVWPKSMNWSNYQLTWVRPIRNILCLFDSEVLEFNLSHLTSNNKSYGHKFMSHEEINIISSEDYYSKLTSLNVIYSRNERLNIIHNGFDEIEKSQNIRVIRDEKLIDEVVGLCEFPVILTGKIDDKFMLLPDEVLIKTVNIHQKFFSAKKDNKLAPIFIFATNLKLDDYSDILSGNQKVLNARLSDALYFYNSDIKKPLADNKEKLDQIIFHRNVGTMKDKVHRIVELSKKFDQDTVTAASLCKCDLVTEMVFEFPDLQGIMASYYLKNEEYNDNIIDAVKNHYKPNGFEDETPKNIAAKLALVDKIDSLTSLMIAGERATGSKDPYALRRLAIGIIRIILDNHIDIDIKEFFNDAADLHSNANINKDILDFFEERLNYFFRAKFETNVVNACVDLSNNPNLVKTQNIIKELNNLLSSKKGNELLSLYKRAKNIIEKTKIFSEITDFYIKTDSEKKLLDTIISLEKTISHNKVEDSLLDLINLKEPFAIFFEENLVNIDDEKVSNNRKAILNKACSLFEQIAKFNIL